MRAFLVAPILATATISALALPIVGGSWSSKVVRALEPAGAADLFNRSIPHNFAGSFRRSEKRYVRRRRSNKCAAPWSSSSSIGADSYSTSSGPSSTGLPRPSDGMQNNAGASSSSSNDGWSSQTSATSTGWESHSTGSSSTDNWWNSATFTASHSSSESSSSSHSTTSTGWWTGPTESSSSQGNSWETTSSSNQESSTQNQWGSSSSDAPASTESSSSAAPTSTESSSSDGPTSTEAPSSTAPTSTESSSSAAPTSTGGGFTGDGALFPVQPAAFWTSASGQSGAIPMQDALKVQAGKLPEIGSAPDGSQAMVCNYKANQIGGAEGFNFYASGNNGNVDVTQAKEVIFSYSLWFAADFDFVKGGKLPGLYGGATFEAAKSCSGGNKKDTCFSTRLMWRAQGLGEIYDYLPPSAHNDYCNTPPKSACNPSYGDSIGRGAWTFGRGQWVQIAQRVKLNDVGQANGEQQVWINGQSVLNLNGLTIRISDDVKFQGIMSQTFFGGSTQDYAPTKEEHAYFKDWSLGILN